MGIQYSKQECEEMFDDSVFDIEMKGKFSSNIDSIEQAELLVKKGYCLAALHKTTPSKNHYEITDADFENNGGEKSWDIQWIQGLSFYRDKYFDSILRDLQ